MKSDAKGGFGLFAILIAALLAAPVHDDSEHHPAHPARGNLSRYITGDDYPVGAARRGVEGTAAFRLVIDKSGRATKCTIMRSAGDAELDATTCALLLARVKLAPARDAHGRPVADIVNSRIAWRLMDDEGSHSLQPPVAMTTWLEVDAHGIRCGFDLNGREVESGRALQCGPFGGDLRAMASDTPPIGARVQMSIVIELDSAPARPSDNSAAGELSMDAAARISVAPDGSVAECRTTRYVASGPLAAMGANRPDLCRLPSIINVNLASPNANAVRFGQIRVQIYVRTPAATRR